MTTNVYLLFLLAIGFSTLNAEFEADFKVMVEKVKLKDGTTLLDCAENCDEVKQTECQCVHFNHIMSGEFNEVIDFIKNGLVKLNMAKHDRKQVLNRLREARRRRQNPDSTKEDTKQWDTPVSPKRFLNYIRELYEKLNT